MTQKKSYSRYFIILQEDEKGYAVASDKLPSGYAKLEMKNEKCKISFYVQNLKKESAPYYVALICGKKDVNKIIKIAELNIDEHGKAEIIHENPIDNIGGLGISMDKISGAAIIRFIDTNMVSVMCGFIGSDITEWKKMEMCELQETREGEPQDETKNVFDKYEEQIERLKNNNIKENNNVKENTNKQPVKKNDNSNKIEVQQPKKEVPPKEEPKEEIKTKEEVQPKEEVKTKEEIAPKSDVEPEIYKDETGKLREENDIEVDKNIEKAYDPAHAHQDSIEEEYTEEGEAMPYSLEQQVEESGYPTGPVGEFFRNTVSEFEEMRHVSHEIKRCKWYKVGVEKLECMHKLTNYNTYTVVFYPMMSYYPYIKKHGHFIVGHKCDKEGRLKYLVYGIPGTKSKTDQPFGGKSGFVTWIPMKEDKECEMGYWLMFYDFKNSTIVIPVR